MVNKPSFRFWNSAIVIQLAPYSSRIRQLWSCLRDAAWRMWSSPGSNILAQMTYHHEQSVSVSADSAPPRHVPRLWRAAGKSCRLWRQEFWRPQRMRSSDSCCRRFGNIGRTSLWIQKLPQRRNSPTLCLFWWLIEYAQLCRCAPTPLLRLAIHNQYGQASQHTSSDHHSPASGAIEFAWAAPARIGIGHFHFGSLRPLFSSADTWPWISYAFILICLSRPGGRPGFLILLNMYSAACSETGPDCSTLFFVLHVAGTERSVVVSPADLVKRASGCSGLVENGSSSDLFSSLGVALSPRTLGQVFLRLVLKLDRSQARRWWAWWSAEKRTHHAWSLLAESSWNSQTSAAAASSSESAPDSGRTRRLVSTMAEPLSSSAQGWNDWSLQPWIADFPRST